MTKYFHYIYGTKREVMDRVSFNRNYYNVFKVCQEFRQRIEDFQRLKKAKQQAIKKDVK